MKCPCLNCPDRTEGCHSDSVCKRGYPEWKKSQDELKEKIRKRKEVDRLLSEGSVRRKGSI